MAASKMYIYNTGVKHMLQNNIDLESDVIKAYPLHSGYTPSTASDSALAQITAFQSTASATVVNAVTLATKVLTGSGATANKWDFDNFSFSSDGDTFQCKYVAFVSSSSVGGVDSMLIGWFDTDTAASTGVEGVQVNVTVPSGGMMKANSNP